MRTAFNLIAGFGGILFGLVLIGSGVTAAAHLIELDASPAAIGVTLAVCGVVGVDILWRGLKVLWLVAREALRGGRDGG